MFYLQLSTPLQQRVGTYIVWFGPGAHSRNGGKLLKAQLHGSNFGTKTVEKCSTQIWLDVTRALDALARSPYKDRDCESFGGVLKVASTMSSSTNRRGGASPGTGRKKLPNSKQLGVRVIIMQCNNRTIILRAHATGFRFRATAPLTLTRGLQ